VVRSGIALDLTYQAIYGPKGLINDVCTVFSACSGLEKFAACVEFRAFDSRKIEILRERGIVGDWNGHLLPNASDEAKELAEEQNQLALGASPADMVRVAARARRDGFHGLGVVLVVSGVRRAEVVLAACEMRAVNELVIASDTARAMLEPASTCLSAA
jgi:DNA-binding transcriptional regulator LsrR (DeoR family)